MDKDIREIRKQLDAWIEEMPLNATAVRQRIDELSAKVASASSKYAPDPKDMDEIQRSFRGLEQDLPGLSKLWRGTQSAKEAISQLQNSVKANLDIRTATQQWCSEQNELLDHIVNVTVEHSTVPPLLAQAEIIHNWARQRRTAVRLLRQIEELAATADRTSPVALAHAEWTRRYLADRIDEPWLDEAESQITALREEFVRTTSSPAPTAADPLTQIKQPEKEVSLRPLNDVSVILAECNEIASALGLHDTEIEGFENQVSNLYQSPNEIDIQHLVNEVNALRIKMGDIAGTACGERRQLLRHRWSIFQQIYQDEPYGHIQKLVQQSETLEPNTTVNLQNLLDCVTEAVKTIDFTVDANRKPLRDAIVKSVSTCREKIESIRACPRTLALDKNITPLEISLPAPGFTGDTTADAFALLERCQQIQTSLNKLQQQASDDIERLKLQTQALLIRAGQIKSAADASELPGVDAIILKLSQATPLTGFLESHFAAMEKDERTLSGIEQQVTQRLMKDLFYLREDNQGWILPLAAFDPGVSEFTDNELSDGNLSFSAVSAAIERERYYRDQIAAVIPKAVAALEANREALIQRLQDRLVQPTFFANPERPSAQFWLEKLHSLPAIPMPPDSTSYAQVSDIVETASAFLERIDGFRKRIPMEVAKIQERLLRLNDMNAATYRPAMATRAKALIHGMEQAMARDQFDLLEFQLATTQAFLDALETDVGLLLCADVDKMAKQLKQVEDTITNPAFKARIKTTLAHLKREGDLKIPSNVVRQEMIRLVNLADTHRGNTQ